MKFRMIDFICSLPTHRYVLTKQFLNFCIVSWTTRKMTPSYSNGTKVFREECYLITFGEMKPLLRI